MNKYLQTIIEVHNNLVGIDVKGEGCIRMANAIISMRNLISEMQQEAANPEPAPTEE